MKHAHQLVCGLLLAAGSSLAACGGVGGAETLFDSGGTGAGGGSGGGTSTTTAESSSSVTTGSTTTTTATTTTTTTTSTGSGVPMLSCGNQMCPVGGQSACCWDNFETNDPPQAECVDGPPDRDGCRTFVAGDGLETRIECQTKAHCDAGEVCCANRVQVQQSSFYDNVRCEGSCNGSDRLLCDPLDATDVCPDGTECIDSQLLPPGYFVCADPNP